MPSGTDDYEELIGIFDEFLLWLDSKYLRKNGPFVDNCRPKRRCPSGHSKAVINKRRSAVAEFHTRLDALAIDQWARDPGFYVDRANTAIRVNID